MSVILKIRNKSAKGIVRMKLSLCIPMYNEEKILPSSIQTISSYMKENFSSDYEIIFINDGSKDASLAIAEQAAKKDETLRVITYAENRGKGYAVRQGVLQSLGDVVIFTDCDLAYGMDVIKEMYGLFEDHPEYDVIVGSRRKHREGYEGYTAVRKFVSLSYIKILSLIGGVKLSDFQCGCKGFRGKVGREIFSRCIIDRFAFDLEALIYAQDLHANIGEMPVKVINHRESSIHIVRDSIRMLKDIRRMKKHRRAEMKKKK